MDLMGGGGNVSSDEDGSMDIKPSLSERGGTGRGAPLKSGSEGPPTGKKTKGRVKIKMEFIDNKLRRYTTFSKRKTGIMKKVKPALLLFLIIHTYIYIKFFLVLKATTVCNGGI
jgi:hypothetical protein